MRTQKQRIFSFLVLLTMVIVLTCIFVACDNNGGSQDHDYKVTGMCHIPVWVVSIIKMTKHYKIYIF